MSLPSDPGVGPSWSLCVSDTWRPNIAGLLSEMQDREYWLQQAAILGISVSDAELQLLTDGASRIINRMCVEYSPDGCSDLEPPSGGIPAFGTVYSKTYSFLLSALPTGWTLNRGTQSAGGLHSSDFHGGSVGWQRRVTATLSLLQPAHARICNPTYLINSSFLVNNAFFLGGFFQSAGGRLTLQCGYPDVATWSPTIAGQQVYATANQVQMNFQVDEKVSQADLLGEAWLRTVYVEASSTTGNPFP